MDCVCNEQGIILGTSIVWSDRPCLVLSGENDLQIYNNIKLIIGICKKKKGIPRDKQRLKGECDWIHSLSYFCILVLHSHLQWAWYHQLPRLYQGYSSSLAVFDAMHIHQGSRNKVEGLMSYLWSVPAVLVNETVWKWCWTDCSFHLSLWSVVHPAQTMGNNSEFVY